MEQYDREVPDVVSSEPFAGERERLVPMSCLESWTVSGDDPDIRGWDVRTVSGRQLGTVSDLLIDEQAGEVVLIDVDLPGTDRHTFVPIRVVRIERGRHVVTMDSADLPSANIARTRRTSASDRSSNGGTVHYPRADRDLRAERVVDSTDLERRRSERRHIERMSTEF
jgi:sporulation protein YlmC with PRC-barrel domain